MESESTEFELGRSVHADPFDVLAGPCIDLDHVPFLDEPRDLEFSPGLGLGRFRDTCGGVSTDTGFSLDDFEGDVRRRGQGDWVPVVENHRHRHAFLQILPIVVDLIRGKFVLFEGFVIHKHEGTPLVVEELCFEFFHVGDFEFVSPFEGPIEDGVPDQVLHFALVERISFAGLNEVDFGQQIRFAVDLNLEAFSQIAGFVACHDASVFFSKCLEKLETDEGC